MSKFTAMIIKTPKSYKEFDVRFFEKEGGEQRGFGFLPKYTGGIIRLIKCPNCERENYAMMVSSGVCAWCSFDTKKVKRA